MSIFIVATEPPLRLDLLLQVAKSCTGDLMILIALPGVLLALAVLALLIGVYFELDTDPHPLFHGMR